MTKKQELYVRGAVTFWGALVYVVIWGLISQFTSIPATYELVSISQFSIVINRWWGILLLPLYLNLALSGCFWLASFFKKRGVNRDDIIQVLIMSFMFTYLACSAIFLDEISLALLLGFVEGFIMAFVSMLILGFRGYLVALLSVILAVTPIVLITGLTSTLLVFSITGLCLAVVIVMLVWSLVAFHRRYFEKIK